VGTNSIHKVPSKKYGSAIFDVGHSFKPERRWAYTCPVCGVTEECGAPYSGRRNSRKTAKDGLYWHLKKEHPWERLVGHPRYLSA